MYRYISKIGLLFFTFFIFSCGSENKLRISSEEELVKVRELALAQFGGDIEIHSLQISSLKDLNNNLGNIHIEYFKEDKELYSRQYNVKVYGEETNLGEEKMRDYNTKFKSLFMKPEGHGKIKLKDFDFNRIMSDLFLALENYRDENIGSWTIRRYKFEVEPNTNAVISDFVLQITPAENATNLEGRNIVTNYYEIGYQVDAEGKLTVKEN